MYGINDNILKSFPTQYNSAHMSLRNLGFLGTLGGAGSWVELSRQTLGTDGDTISIGSLDPKEYYMVLHYGLNSGQLFSRQRVGNGSLDSGANYAQRLSLDHASDVTGVSSTEVNWDTNGQAVNVFNVGYIHNLATVEKLGMGRSITPNTAGAANIPNGREANWKWANTSNQIDTIGHINAGTGDFLTGSETVVLGWDGSDNHIDSFWEEIGSGTGTGIADVTFTSKKYIWFQGFFYADNTTDYDLRLGNTSLDSGTNYSQRISSNGGASSTFSSDTKLDFQTGWSSQYRMAINGFMINVSSEEKLTIIDFYGSPTGAASEPIRYNQFGKWTNTSNQANHIGIINSAGTLDSNSVLKVWGAD